MAYFSSYLFRISDPGSRGGQSSPLPATVYVPSFLSREEFKAFSLLVDSRQIMQIRDERFIHISVSARNNYLHGRIGTHTIGLSSYEV